MQTIEKGLELLQSYKMRQTLKKAKSIFEWLKNLRFGCSNNNFGLDLELQKYFEYYYIPLKKMAQIGQN